MSVWDVIQQDFSEFADFPRLVQVALRLGFAALLGGLLGYERERTGKAAGLRTHMLVTVGAALFIIVPRLEGMPLNDASRVIQGIATGIGFLGGGTILKLTQDEEVKGLTTAAGIWVAAAIGIAVGFGQLGTAVLATLFSFTILGILQTIELRIPPVRQAPKPHNPHHDQAGNVNE